jgi:hypothetical protein
MGKTTNLVARLQAKHHRHLARNASPGPCALRLSEEPANRDWQIADGDALTGAS